MIPPPYQASSVFGSFPETLANGGVENIAAAGGPFARNDVPDERKRPNRKGKKLVSRDGGRFRGVVPHVCDRHSEARRVRVAVNNGQVPEHGGVESWQFGDGPLDYAAVGIPEFKCLVHGLRGYPVFDHLHVAARSLGVAVYSGEADAPEAPWKLEVEDVFQH